VRCDTDRHCFAKSTTAASDNCNFHESFPSVYLIFPV
jgi:hypothetical protein